MALFGNFSHGVFVVLIIIILMYYLYEHFFAKSASETENYENFSRELHSDMDKYGIDDKDQAKIETIVEKIVDRKKKEKNAKNIINACKNGLIRGCIVGFVSAGIPGAIASGTTYGVLNGFMHGFFE